MSRSTPSLYRTTGLVAVMLIAALVLSAAATGADTAVVRATEVSGPDAPAPFVLNYQGRLADPVSGAAKPDGTYQMTFSLYEVASGGASFWTEGKDVQVKGGLFSTLLGDVTALDPARFDGRALWLGITVGGQLTDPRLPVSFVAYALHANRAGSAVSAGIADLAANAERLGGQLPASYAAASHNHDAGNIVSGILSTSRYSAIDDLAAEGYLANANGDLAQNNGVLQATLNADLLDGQHAAAFAAASHNHDTSYYTQAQSDSRFVNATGDTMSGSIFGPILSVSNTSTASTAYGIYGSTASSGNGVAGVRGSAGVPSVTISGKHGVLGQSDTGKGVVGVSQDSYGVYGWSTNNWGIRGEGSNGGVFGLAWVAGSTAVRGENTATTGWNYGVYGVNNSTGGGGGVRGDGAYVGAWGESSGRWGVYGRSTGTSSSYGVYGTVSAGTNNYAGYFSGPVYVSGALTKAGGGFKIDHPLDPENKYLYHSFVESPEMMNVYNGNVVLDAEGKAWVQLPDWFEALNQDFRYQLTAIGGPGPNLHIGQKIQNNRFQIAGGTPGLEVSWQVTGIRHDPYAEAHRLPVEEDKPAEEKGTYLNADAYGQPETLSAGYLSGPAPEATPVEVPDGRPEISGKTP